ncbi:MAG: hypothetical protein FWC74_10500 [Candidatus Bathyarchaeota archaeon]|nr:hypothetical protein [Candidatus Termitimicrobium sp.]
MIEKQAIREHLLNHLFDELARLHERYKLYPEAVEALEAVKFWAMDETVTDL